MSSSRDDESRESGFRKMILDAERDARSAMYALKHEAPNASIGTKQRAASELSKYRDILYRHRNADALSTPWDERDANLDTRSMRCWGRR